MPFTPINRSHSSPPAMDLPYNSVLMSENIRGKQPKLDCGHPVPAVGAAEDIQQQATNSQCTYSKKRKHSEPSDELIDPLIRHGAADARKKQKLEEPSASSVETGPASSPLHSAKANDSGASPNPVSSAQTTPNRPSPPPEEGYAVVVDVTTWYPAATCTFSPGTYATRAEAVERLAQQLEVWSQNNSIPALPRENWSWNPGHPVSPVIQEQKAWNRDTFRGCVRRVPGPSLPTLVRATGPKPACESCKICERCAMLATTRSDRNMQQICDQCQTKLYQCPGFAGCSRPANNSTATRARPELVYRVAIRRISKGSSIDGLKFYWDLDQANSTLQQLVEESVSSKRRTKEDQEWDRKSIVGIFKKTDDKTMYVENLVDNLGRRVCAYVEPMLVHLEPQQQPSGYPPQSYAQLVPQYPQPQQQTQQVHRSQQSQQQHHQGHPPNSYSSQPPHTHASQSYAPQPPQASYHAPPRYSAPQPCAYPSHGYSQQVQHPQSRPQHTAHAFQQQHQQSHQGYAPQDHLPQQPHRYAPQQQAYGYPGAGGHHHGTPW